MSRSSSAEYIYGAKPRRHPALHPWDQVLATSRPRRPRRTDGSRQGPTGPTRRSRRSRCGAVLEQWGGNTGAGGSGGRWREGPPPAPPRRLLPPADRAAAAYDRRSNQRRQPSDKIILCRRVPQGIRGSSADRCEELVSSQVEFVRGSRGVTRPVRGGCVSRLGGGDGMRGEGHRSRSLNVCLPVTLVRPTPSAGATVRRTGNSCQVKQTGMISWMYLGVAVMCWQ